MNILLFSNPWSYGEIAPDFLHRKDGWFRTFKDSRMHTIRGAYPPLGLLYLSAVLKKEGHRVRVLDGFVCTWDEIEEALQAERTDMVGIYCMTPDWPKVKKSLKTIREKWPHIKTVVGGPHPSAWRAKCLEESPELDFVGAGEGEPIITGLTQHIQRGATDFSAVPGLMWRSPDGEIIDNGYGPVVRNLDELPLPDREALPIIQYTPTLSNYKRLPSTTITASRGCPYTCTFCQHELSYRQRSIESVLDEMETLQNEFGIRDITFYDETFTLQPKRCKALAQGMLDRGIDLTWAVNGRVDNRVDSETLRLMARAGCWRMLFGIESGNQRVLDLMRKKTKLHKTHEAIENTRKAGIETYGMFIFGTPGETYEEGLETIDLALSLKLDYAAFSFFTPFPGTEAYERLKDKFEFDFAETTGDRISFVPDSMTRTQLETLMRRGYRSFYLRPSYILKRLGRIRSFEDIRKNIAGLEGILAS